MQLKQKEQKRAVPKMSVYFIVAQKLSVDTEIHCFKIGRLVLTDIYKASKDKGLL